MSKTTYTTSLFEIAQQRGLSLQDLASLGGNLYSANYLHKIRSGLRPVPDSLTFQQWAARTLGLPRHTLFFALTCTSVVLNNPEGHKTHE